MAGRLVQHGKALAVGACDPNRLRPTIGGTRGAAGPRAARIASLRSGGACAEEVAGTVVEVTTFVRRDATYEPWTDRDATCGF
jgi:hypothetical protein